MATIDGCLETVESSIGRKIGNTISRIGLDNTKRTNHFAFITKGSKIISFGINKYKTHPRAPGKYKQIHAEVDAILNAEYIPEGSVMYSIRILKNGQYAMAKPCESCEKYISRFPIRRVIYTLDEYTFNYMNFD